MGQAGENHDVRCKCQIGKAKKEEANLLLSSISTVAPIEFDDYKPEFKKIAKQVLCGQGRHNKTRREDPKNGQVDELVSK